VSVRSSDRTEWRDLENCKYTTRSSLKQGSGPATTPTVGEWTGTGAQSSSGFDVRNVVQASRLRASWRASGLDPSRPDHSGLCPVSKATARESSVPERAGPKVRHHRSSGQSRNCGRRPGRNRTSESKPGGFLNCSPQQMRGSHWQTREAVARSSFRGPLGGRGATVCYATPEPPISCLIQRQGYGPRKVFQAAVKHQFAQPRLGR